MLNHSENFKDNSYMIMYKMESRKKLNMESYLKNSRGIQLHMS